MSPVAIGLARASWPAAALAVFLAGSGAHAGCISTDFGAGWTFHNCLDGISGISVDLGAGMVYHIWRDGIADIGERSITVDSHTGASHAFCGKAHPGHRHGMSGLGRARGLHGGFPPSPLKLSRPWLGEGTHYPRPRSWRDPLSAYR